MTGLMQEVMSEMDSTPSKTCLCALIWSSYPRKACVSSRTKQQFSTFFQKLLIFKASIMSYPSSSSAHAHSGTNGANLPRHQTCHRDRRAGSPLLHQTENCLQLTLILHVLHPFPLVKAPQVYHLPVLPCHQPCWSDCRGLQPGVMCCHRRLQQRQKQPRIWHKCQHQQGCRTWRKVLLLPVASLLKLVL